MYQVAIRRDFVARHFLVGGDFGKENDLHAHDYSAEVILEGSHLDRFGYLVDITRIQEILDGLVARYRGRILNEDPEFAGLNPSIEHFSRILWTAFCRALGPTDLERVTVRVFENADAWASFGGRP